MASDKNIRWVWSGVWAQKAQVQRTRVFLCSYTRSNYHMLIILISFNWISNICFMDFGVGQSPWSWWHWKYSNCQPSEMRSVLSFSLCNIFNPHSWINLKDNYIFRIYWNSSVIWHIVYFHTASTWVFVVYCEKSGSVFDL